MNTAYTFLAIVLATVTSSCSGPSFMGSTGNPSAYYETYFVDESVNQYFIKPVEFESDSEEVELDITMRIGKGSSDTATINYTINGPRLIKTVDAFIITNGTASATAISTKSMFAERQGSEYASRLTSKVHRDSLMALFNAESPWTISLTAYRTTATYVAQRSARNMREFVNRNLITIVTAK